MCFISYCNNYICNSKILNQDISKKIQLQIETFLIVIKYKALYKLFLLIKLKG